MHSKPRNQNRRNLTTRSHSKSQLQNWAILKVQSLESARESLCTASPGSRTQSLPGDQNKQVRISQHTESQGTRTEQVYWSELTVSQGTRTEWVQWSELTARLGISTNQDWGSECTTCLGSQCRAGLKITVLPICIYWIFLGSSNCRSTGSVWQLVKVVRTKHIGACLHGNQKLHQMPIQKWHAWSDVIGDQVRRRIHQSYWHWQFWCWWF